MRGVGSSTATRAFGSHEPHRLHRPSIPRWCGPCIRFAAVVDGSWQEVAHAQFTLTVKRTVLDAPGSSGPVNFQLSAPVPPSVCAALHSTAGAGVGLAGVFFWQLASVAGVVSACAAMNAVYCGVVSLIVKPLIGVVPLLV